MGVTELYDGICRVTSRGADHKSGSFLCEWELCCMVWGTWCEGNKGIEDENTSDSGSPHWSPPNGLSRSS